MPTPDRNKEDQERNKPQQPQQAPERSKPDSDMPGDRERALAAGCTGYIEKPIDPETFAGDVSRFLGTSTLRRA